MAQQLPKQILFEVDLINFVAIHIYDLIKEVPTVVKAEDDDPARFLDLRNHMVYAYFTWFNLTNIKHKAWLSAVRPDGKSNLMAIREACLKKIGDTPRNRMDWLGGEQIDDYSPQPFIVDEHPSFGIPARIVTWSVLFDNGAVFKNCANADNPIVFKNPQRDRTWQYLTSAEYHLIRDSVYKQAGASGDPSMAGFSQCDNFVPPVPYNRSVIWGKFEGRAFVLAVRQFGIQGKTYGTVNPRRAQIGIFTFPPFHNGPDRCEMGRSPSRKQFAMAVEAMKNVYAQIKNPTPVRVEGKRTRDESAASDINPDVPSLQFQLLRLYTELAAKCWGDLGMIADAATLTCDELAGKPVGISTTDVMMAAMALEIGVPCLLIRYLPGEVVLHMRPTHPLRCRSTEFYPFKDIEVPDAVIAAPQKASP